MIMAYPAGKPRKAVFYLNSVTKMQNLRSLKLEYQHLINLPCPSELLLLVGRTTHKLLRSGSNPQWLEKHDCHQNDTIYSLWSTAYPLEKPIVSTMMLLKVPTSNHSKNKSNSPNTSRQFHSTKGSFCMHSHWLEGTPPSQMKDKCGTGGTSMIANAWINKPKGPIGPATSFAFTTILADYGV